MKPVAPYPFFSIAARQGEGLCHRRLRAVKCRIEACNLRQRRRHLRHRFDSRQIVRLMQRSQRDESLQLGQRFRVDEHRRGELHAAMHDAMPCRDNAVPA